MISHQSKTTAHNTRLAQGAQPIALSFGQQNALLEKFKPADVNGSDRLYLEREGQPQNMSPQQTLKQSYSGRPLGSAAEPVLAETRAALRDSTAIQARESSGQQLNQKQSGHSVHYEHPERQTILTTVDPSVPQAEAQAAARFFIENQNLELEKQSGGASPSERTMSNLNSSDHLFVANLQAVSLEKLVKSKLEVLFQQQRDANIELSGLYDIVLEQVEKPLIELALQSRNGNQVKTAQLLGINRNTLKKKIDGYKIKVRRSSQRED